MAASAAILPAMAGGASGGVPWYAMMASANGDMPLSGLFGLTANKQGGLGNLLGGLFGGMNANNPADAAMPYLNDIEGKLKPYMQPYMNAGNQALPALQTQFSNLMNNPTGMMNQIGSTFQQSPGYQWQVDQMMNASNRAAAAGGMLGTPAQQRDVASNVNNLANQDYYNYLSHGTNMYNTGLSGMQGLAGLGFNASNSLSNNIMNAMLSQAMLAYSGAAAQNQGQSGGFGAALGGLSSFF